MSGLRATLVFVLCGMCSVAYAHNLHVGDMSFALNQNKTTSPALGVSIDGATVYGALYSGTAPGQTLHVYRDIDYWLGQNCAAGKYSETGVSACTDCTIGHFCPGGAYSVSCTGGAIACTGKNNTTDAAAGADAPVNTFMTLDQVNEFIPVTDFSDWRQVSCCFRYVGANSSSPETANDVSNACAHGTLGPGTYLFTARYTNVSAMGYTDGIDGTLNSIASAFIAVFDHPVGYASVHGKNIFQHFVDTEHANYTEWTISTTSIGGWMQNKNATNITNLTDLPNVSQLCVFELK